MAICQDCEKDMSSKHTKSCKLNIIFIDGKWYKRNTKYFDDGKRCHDCNIENKDGNVHHWNCDIERCPKCDGQLIMCDCDIEYVGGGGL
jgi:major membrane immunogen (membrane-anchored lipoprotein)